MEPIGYIIGETTTTKLSILCNEPPNVGGYVSIKYNYKKNDNNNGKEENTKEIIGMIESVSYGNPIFEEVLNTEDILKLKNLEDSSSYYIICRIKILGDVKNKEIPKIPPKPGTEVYEASEDILKRMFSNGHIEIGTLLTNNIPVKLDVNKLCSRHLAILAITGMGKSNTVAHLLSELNKLNGTVLIFDVHGEYKHIESYNENNELRINIIEPQINIYNIGYDSFCNLAGVDSQATKQRPYIRRAIKEVKSKYREGDFNSCEEYIKEIISTLQDYIEDNKKDKDSIETAIFRLEDMLNFKGHIIRLHYNPIDKIREGYINIVPLEELDEGDMDTIVSYFTKEILADRKKALRNNDPKPIFLIFEEAHLLIPQNRDTKSKIYISRIAREGRKFGIGLCLVSQRPKTLDQESLSQCNNMIISKLIEPNDQSHVQHASESLSEDLLKQLPGLNIGEAIILGPAISIPAIVKIHKFNGTYGGEDIPIVDIWKNNSKNRYSDKDILTIDDDELD